MFNIKPLFYAQKNKWLVMTYVILGLYVYISLFFGVSSFLTTTYTYSLVVVLFYWLTNRFEMSKNVSLSVYTLIASLFLSEFTLRYIIRYPLSYGEQNGGSYILVDNYQRKSNLRFKYIEGRKDLYTLEFDPGEIRDNQCGDYQYPNDTCNALGLRGELPAKEKDIILVLGDSFTEGAGAPSDSTVPALLGDYFQQNDSTVGVLNAGISGNDIFFDWEMAQKLAKQYKIKQVVFMINSTDVNDVATRGGNERFCDNGLLNYNQQPWWEPFYAVSFVFRLFAHNALKLNYNLMTSAELSKRNQEAINKIQELISAEIIPWCSSHNITPIFVAFPLILELDNEYSSYPALVNLFNDIPQVKFIDCHLPIATIEKNKDLYWKNDLHFKPTGYKIIADCIITNYYLKFDQ